MLGKSFSRRLPFTTILHFMSEEWYSHTKPRLTKEGILPHFRYRHSAEGKSRTGSSVVRNVPPQRARRRHSDQGWTGQFSGGPRHRLLHAP